MMFDKVLEISVKVTYKEHIYTCRNELFRPKKNGAIGMRLTWVFVGIARLFLSTLDKSGVEIYLTEK